MAAARAAWPGIEVPDAAFAQFVAERITPERTLDQLHATDLYLACACALKDPAAQAAFEPLFAAVRSSVTAVSADVVEEVEQTLRERLLYGDSPRITDYAGSGELVAWLRVVAVRTALGLRREQTREAALADAMIAATPLSFISPDPQIEHLKRQYLAQFRAAFAESLQLLDDRERSLLRHRYLYGANVDEIAKIYAVHRATAARWVAKAEDLLYSRTRKALIRRLQIPQRELDSVMRLLQSQLDASLSDLLSRSDH